MEMRVSSYRSREELERYCDLLDPEQRKDYFIAGTTEELARFQLGPHTKVHGIPCKATDDASLAPSVLGTQAERIKAKGHGLNGQLTYLPE